MVLNSLAYLGFFCIQDIEFMTIKEYQLRMEAYQIQEVKKNEAIAMQAWLNQAVQATTGKKKPRPKFTTFDSFFDTQANIQQVRDQYEGDFEISHLDKGSLKQKRVEIFAKRMNDFKKLKEEGKIIPISERRD